MFSFRKEKVNKRSNATREILVKNKRSQASPESLVKKDNPFVKGRRRQTSRSISFTRGFFLSDCKAERI